jgi:hypothetical protein
MLSGSGSEYSVSSPRLVIRKSLGLETLPTASHIEPSRPAAIVRVAMSLLEHVSFELKTRGGPEAPIRPTRQFGFPTSIEGSPVRGRGPRVNQTAPSEAAVSLFGMSRVATPAVAVSTGRVAPV